MNDFTHDQLVARGAVWLQSNRRCEPVLHGLSSGPEIPDAIGWSSVWKHRGSIVLEVKVSRSDFIRDGRKVERWVHPEYPHTKVSKPATAEHRTSLEAQGFTLTEVPRMGDFRYILCPAELLTEADIDRYAPDHGLLWASGARVRVQVVREAPRRLVVDHRAEAQHLRMALIHTVYNVEAHGYEVHTPTITKWAGWRGMTANPSKRLRGL